VLEQQRENAHSVSMRKDGIFLLFFSILRGIMTLLITPIYDELVQFAKNVLTHCSKCLWFSI
jgi:hypothetical protein